MLKEIKKIIFRSSYILRKNKIRTIDFFKNPNNNLIGGAKIFSVSYNDSIYKFEQSEIDNNHFILYSYEENPLDCVSIIISKKDKLAEIHGIGNYQKCLQTSNMNIGSTLLKITIKMLKKYKDKLGIIMITLTDNSIKSCGIADRKCKAFSTLQPSLNLRKSKDFSQNNCGKENIILSKMLFLLSSDTWYGKYGFRPYDIQVKSMNERTNKEYDRNKEIMESITITQANILKYIEMTKKERIIQDIKKLLLVEPNMLVTDFLSQFLKDYDKTCKYFSMFYEELFKDLGLTDFYRQSFALLI